jgi:hypothetical protein
VDISLILSIGSLLGVILTAVRLFNVMTEKARDEGRKDQVMQEFGKDLDGLGRKVNHLCEDHKQTSNKVIELESVLVTKLDNIERLLENHIMEDKRG